MECDIEKCPLTKTIESVEKKVDKNTDDIEAVNKTVSNFLISYGKIETLITEIVIPKLNGLDQAFKDMLEKPGKRWDILIASLISGGGAYIISQILS